MSSPVQADVNATRTPNRISSANHLLYMAYGMVLFTAIASAFQYASFQGKYWTITLGPIIILLGTYVSKLEARITPLESQIDHHQRADDAQH